MNYKQKALDHVRSVCPELMELGFGCRVYIKDEQANGTYSGYYTEGKYRGVGRINVSHIDIGHVPYDSMQMNIIGHTPHLENFIHALHFGEFSSRDELLTEAENMHALVMLYDCKKGGDEQSDAFYQAWLEMYEETRNV